MHALYLLAHTGSMETNTGLKLFMYEQRELIRKRTSNALRNIQQRGVKGANKRGRRVAPQVGGTKTGADNLYQASPSPKTGGQSGITIDLSHLPDSDGEAESAAAVSVPASEAASATAHPAHAATSQPTPTRVPRDFRKFMDGPREDPLNPVVPATIRALWEEVEGMYDRRHVDPPLCPHSECPYCTGALMEQRFDLMQRLVTLEKLVWLGDRRKKR